MIIKLPNAKVVTFKYEQTIIILYQIKVSMYQLSYELFISRKKPVFKSTFIYKKYNLVLVFQHFFVDLYYLYNLGLDTLSVVH